MRTSQAGAGPFGCRGRSRIGGVRSSVALWWTWTESDIRKIAEEVLAGDDGRASTRKHLEGLLREQTITALGAELNATAEHIVESAKVALQRKLNAVYAAQAERLAARLGQLDQDLEAKAPAHQRRLEALEVQLDEVSARYEGWLDEPAQILKSMLADGMAQFTEEIAKISKESRSRARMAMKNLEAEAQKNLETRLHDLVLDAVREHVTSTEFDQDGLSNKQLAAAKRILLRAAKRLRRSTKPECARRRAGEADTL